MAYDSTDDTMAHIAAVQGLLDEVSGTLTVRAATHDRSKLKEPEKSMYDEWTPKLREMTYGSPEYKQALKRMGKALEHHYSVSAHHPEHGSPGLEWKPIAGFESLYEISNYGDLRSLTRVVKRDGKRGDLTINGRDMKAQPTPKGYLRVQLNKDGAHTNRFLHVLVAEAFLPNPDDKPEVNHLNGVKTDNRATNLSWATASENQQHAYDTGLKEARVKYVVHCPELDLTTLGMERMKRKLREQGYEKGHAAGIWRAMDTGGKHLGLTFEGTLLAEYRRSQIRRMSLLDLVEMLADWAASVSRVKDGDLSQSILMNQERFGYGDEICEILLNTARELGWIT